MALALALLAAAARAADRPRVVASFSVLGDWVRQVGGADVDLAVLLGPDGDPHAFEPSPAQAKALARADVVFEVGDGFDPWVEGMAVAAGERGKRVKVTPAGGEPHAWGDVESALHAVEVIRDRLAAVDAPRAAGHRRRAAAYGAELRALDAWIRTQVAQVPRERRRLVTTHDTLGWWGRRYGFEVESLFPSSGPEGADLSAGRLAQVTERLRASGAAAVFVERASDERPARAAARAAGVRVAPPLFTDALGPPGGPGGSYVEMMRHNARVIAEALK